MTVRIKEVIKETLINIRRSPQYNRDNVSYVLTADQVAYINDCLSYSGLRLRLAQRYIIVRLQITLSYTDHGVSYSAATAQFASLFFTKL